MLRDFQTLGDELDRLLLEMGRIVQHEQIRDTEYHANVDNCLGHVLGRGVGAIEKPHIVRVVIPQDENILVVGDARSDLDLIEVQQVVFWRTVDRRTER